MCCHWFTAASSCTVRIVVSGKVQCIILSYLCPCDCWQLSLQSSFQGKSVWQTVFIIYDYAFPKGNNKNNLTFLGFFLVPESEREQEHKSRDSGVCVCVCVCVCGGGGAFWRKPQDVHVVLIMFRQIIWLNSWKIHPKLLLCWPQTCQTFMIAMLLGIQCLPLYFVDR